MPVEGSALASDVLLTEMRKDDDKISWLACGPEPPDPVHP